MADGKVIIETGLDTKGVESGLKKFQGLVKTGFKVATASVAAAGVAAIKMGADFEAGMSEVQAISGASGKDLAALTAKAKEMGAATKFSATESAEALKYMAMAGWKTKQMTAGLPGIMNLAAASGEDLATVSDIVTDSMTAFGLQAKEAGHFADVLAKASSSSNTNVGMMGATFKYVAPIAGSMKYSIEDTATAIGLMANAGIKGEQAGTTLRAVLTRLVKPPKDAAAALDELGVSAKNSDGTMKPLREVIGDLREKFAGLNDSQKAQYAASIAGQEAMSGLLAIVNASPSDFDKLTKAIDKSDGSAEKMAKTMQNNLKGQITILKSSLEGLGIEIYDNVKKPLTSAAKAGIKAVNSLTAKVKKGGIKAIIPAETITALKNFGTTALNIAKTVLPILGKGIATVGNNIKTVLPAVTALVVGFKTLKVVTTVAAAFTTASAAMEGAKTGTILLGTALNLFTGKTIAATGATTAFNAAMTALGGPIGLAVIAIGALAAGTIAYAIATKGSKKESDDAAQSIQNLTQKRKELSKEYQQNEKERKSNISSAKDEANTTQFLFARLKDLNKIQGKTTAQKQEMARIVDELNEKLPDLNLHYDKEKDKLDKTTESIRKQIDAQKDLLLAKAEQKNMESLAGDIVSQEKQVASAKKAVGKATKEQAKAQDELNEAEQKWKDAGGSKLITEYNDYIVVRDHLKEKKKLQGEANDELEKEKKKLDELNSKYDKTAKSYNTKMNLPDITKDITEMAKKAKIKGSEIKKSLLEGIASGKYAKPKNGDDLKQLINLDGLMKDAKNAGLKIPEYLKSGISNGSISFKEAVTQLENGLNFQNLYEAAFGKGAEIPRGLAEGIRSGQYAVPTTVNGMKALVQFNDLQTKGLKAGVQIPSKIAEGIASGKIKPSEAVKQMQSLIDFSDAVKKSGKAGDDTVKALVKSVNDGKTSPKKAMGELAKIMGDVGEKEAGKAGNKTGKKIDDSTVAGVDKNKGKIKTATQGAVDNAKTVDTSGFNSLGSSIASGIAAGIGGNAGVVAAAAVSVVNQALAEAKSKKGADVNSPSKKFRDKLGTAIPEGLAKGIYKGSGAVTKASVAMTQATLNAARKDLGIHSPSLVFNKAIGKYIPLGMALGIEKNAGKAAKAAMKVINVTIGAAKKGIPSPGKMFKILKGETIPKGIAKGVREGQSELVAEMQGVISTALSAAKNATYKGNYSEIGSNLLSGLSDSLSIAKQRSSETIQEIVDQAYNKQVKASEKAEAKLQKRIDKLGSKKENKKKKAKLKQELKDLKAANAKKEKQLKEAGEKAANAYNTAFEKEADRLTKIAEEKIQELSEKYQEQYNEIKSLRDNLTSKQQSYGSLYDLDQNLYDIEDYQKRLKALENKIPDSMMQRILGMDVEEGRQYMAWFQSLTAAEQKAYTDKWNKQQSMAESFSEAFFKDDFEKINKEYQAAIKKETDNLNAEMKKAGANVAKGLAAGITGETRNLSKAMKKLCKDIVKAAKKELKIKSPSRVFAQIGKFTIQGAEKGQEKEAPRLYRQVETVADTMAARFAKAKLNIPELQSRMQTAVSRQMSKMTASVQPQVIYAGGGGITTIEKTVYTGPEKIEVVTNIEGREAARTLAPFMDSRLNSMADRKARGGV